MCDGKVERAVRTWRGQFVTMKDHIETMTGVELPANSAILTWLVMHAAQTLNCYKVLECGRTSYELTTGHRFKAVAVPFGEKGPLPRGPKQNGEEAHGMEEWRLPQHQPQDSGAHGRKRGRSILDEIHSSRG